MTAPAWVARVRRVPRGHVVVLLAVELYLTATLVGYFWGPLRLEDGRPVELAALVLAYQAALAVGFLASRVPRDRLPVPLGRRPLRRLSLAVGVGAGLSIAFSWWSIGVSAQGWAPWTVARALAAAAVDPGAAYLANYRSSGTSASVVSELMSLCAPMTFAAAVVGLALWRRHPRTVQALVVVDLLLQVVTGVVRGQNLAVFEVAVVLSALLLVRGLRDEPQADQGHRRRVLVGQLGALGAVAVIFFASNTGSRISTGRPEQIVGIPIDYGAPVMHLLPEAVHLPAALLFAYLCQGYQGLSLALGMDLRSTWGLGSSVTLMDNVGAVTGQDLRGRTYVERMDPVWEQSTNWHTAYTWFAHDVGPYGVVVVMLLLGWFAGRVTFGALRGDLVATVLFPLVLLQLLFLPANALVLSNPLLLTPLALWGAVFMLSQLTDRWSWLSRRAPASDRSESVPAP